MSMWRRILGLGKPAQRDVKQSFDQGDPELVDAVSGFIDSTFGSGGSVFHEVASSLVHIDLWFVPPGRERPWITVLTSGMAEKPLPSHPDFRGPSRVELVLALSADWPLDPAAWRQERNWWPMRMLKEICRYPHGCGMPVGVGHTLEVPALSGNQFGFHAVLLVPPKVFGGAMPAFPLRGEQVCFLSPVPIFEDELHFARTAGSRELWNRLAARPIPELVGPRPSVAKR
ncbi:MAG: suppressor of fused domain protein [Phycisphaerales bacterium]|nr:suppressor of fused domain protein [Phycisphaerales bacterium]